MAFTWLNKIGTDVIHFFEKALPIAQEVDTVAAPFITAFSPGLQTAISATLTEIAKAEALGVAAGNTSGSNAVKLASVLSAVAPTITPIVAAATGKTPTSMQLTSFINNLVAAANAFEAVATTSSAPTTVAISVPPVLAVGTPAQPINTVVNS
jgi:hypothetical protein